MSDEEKEMLRESAARMLASVERLRDAATVAPWRKRVYLPERQIRVVQREADELAQLSTIFCALAEFIDE